MENPETTPHRPNQYDDFARVMRSVDLVDLLSGPDDPYAATELLVAVLNMDERARERLAEQLSQSTESGHRILAASVAAQLVMPDPDLAVNVFARLLRDNEAAVRDSVPFELEAGSDSGFTGTGDFGKINRNVATAQNNLCRFQLGKIRRMVAEHTVSRQSEVE